jgi:hypothetical protein
MFHRQNGKKQCSPSERSLKRGLANSGYSKDIADKIWKCYNLQELEGKKKKKEINGRYRQLKRK